MKNFFRFFLFLLVIESQIGIGEEPWGVDAGLNYSTSPKPTPFSTPSHFLIQFHQKVLSPIDGPRSHFYPCSSQYAKEAIRNHGQLTGWLLAFDRLLRENGEEWVYRTITINGETVKFDPAPMRTSSIKK